MSQTVSSITDRPNGSAVTIVVSLLGMDHRNNYCKRELSTLLFFIKETKTFLFRDKKNDTRLKLNLSCTFVMYISLQLGYVMAF